jgi:hypothetical protein
MRKMEKRLDKQGRWRNKTVAFRVSPEEDKVIEAKVRMCGLTKQDYIIRRLEERPVVVMGNPKVYKALRNQMADILEELKRIGTGDPVDDDLKEIIRTMAMIMDGMKEE